MKFLTITFLTVFMLNSCVSQSVEGKENLVKISKQIAEQLSKGEYENVTETFDANMKEAITVEQLKSVWEGLVYELGDYDENGSVTSTQVQGYDVIYLILKFKKGPFKLKTIFNSSEEVIGMLLIPVTAE